MNQLSPPTPYSVMALKVLAVLLLNIATQVLADLLITGTNGCEYGIDFPRYAK
jgi:hypothetical protein